MVNNLTIFEYVGGSHAYGLATPTSDVDKRGVFINTDPLYILGFYNYKHQAGDGEGEDSMSYELRHFLHLLSRGNTQAMEALWYEDNPITSTPTWEYIKSLKYELVSSKNVFASLRGYMQGELHLANGKRTGRLGSKRKEALDKYGYSPKNFVNLFRLAFCGIEFFLNGEYPVNVSETDKKFGEQLLDLKTHPEKYYVDSLNKTAAFYEAKLVEAFEKRKHTFEVNESVVKHVLLDAYREFLS
jgi:hypothetical protein